MIICESAILSSNLKDMLDDGGISVIRIKPKNGDYCTKFNMNLLKNAVNDRLEPASGHKKPFSNLCEKPEILLTKDLKTVKKSSQAAQKGYVTFIDDTDKVDPNC